MREQQPWWNADVVKVPKVMTSAESPLPSKITSQVPEIRTRIPRILLGVIVSPL